MKQTLKDGEQLKSDINGKLSLDITSVVTSLKSLNSLQFSKSLGSFKAGETDEFVVKLSVKDNASGVVAIMPLADIPVYKPIKVDYSAGLFFSGLYDETYTKTVAISIDNTVNPAVEKKDYTIHKLDGGATSFGAMGYINFHSQLNQGVNFGGSLGAELLFNKATKLVVSPTLSLFIGKYQRLIIHGGIAFAQVDRVYSIYGENSFSDSAYVPETKTTVKGSFLFGASWNLSRK